MNLSALLVIPGLVCLFWAVVHAYYTSHTRYFRVLFFLLISITFTAAGDVLLAPMLRSESMAHIVIMVFAPAIIPLTCLYFAILYRSFSYKPLYLYWIVFPAVLGTAALILTSIMGFEYTNEFLARYHAGFYSDGQPFLNSLESLYYTWTVLVFRTVLLSEFAFMIVYGSWLGRRCRMKPWNLYLFLFKGQKIAVLELQTVLALGIVLIVVVKLFFHGRFFAGSPTWSILFAVIHSILYFYFGLIALFGSENYVTRTQIRKGWRYNFSPETKEEVLEQLVVEMSDQLTGEARARVLFRLGMQKASANPSLSKGVMDNMVSVSKEKSSLASRFHRLMMDEQLFLLPALTLTDVADRLKTNKTYVSKMVNQTYNAGFPELLNILRIEYAMKYLKNHPDVTQGELARTCGFQSASSFNTTFKRIAGYTPKVWVGLNTKH